MLNNENAPTTTRRHDGTRVVWVDDNGGGWAVMHSERYVIQICVFNFYSISLTVNDEEDFPPRLSEPLHTYEPHPITHTEREKTPVGVFSCLALFQTEQGDGLSCPSSNWFIVHFLFTTFNLTTLHRNYVTRCTTWHRAEGRQR